MKNFIKHVFFRTLRFTIAASLLVSVFCLGIFLYCAITDEPNFDRLLLVYSGGIFIGSILLLIILVAEIPIETLLKMTQIASCLTCTVSILIGIMHGQYINVMDININIPITGYSSGIMGVVSSIASNQLRFLVVLNR